MIFALVGCGSLHFDGEEISLYHRVQDTTHLDTLEFNYCLNGSDKEIDCSLLCLTTVLFTHCLIVQPKIQAVPHPA